MMKRVLKKIVALSLAFSLFIVATPISYAADSNGQNVLVNSKDVYAEQEKESVNVDGQQYSFEYYYNTAGNRTIRVVNTYNNSAETIVYDSKSGQIIANGEVIATLETIVSKTLDSKIDYKDAYQYLGTTTKKVTWKAGASVTTVAAALAVAIGSIATAGAVIAAMGVAAIGGLASVSIGGTVKTKAYELRTPSVINYKFIVTYTATTGESFGPYTFYMAG